MIDPLKKILSPVNELQNIRGIDLPIGLEFLQLVITGPPGAGKSYYIEQIGGWPNEGYLDLSQKGWWRNQTLIFRPREIHLGLPFKHFKEPFTVFDKEYLKCEIPPEIDFSRIRIPPAKTNFLQTNYQERYIFEFLIPSPSKIYEQRLARRDKGYFPVDDKLTLEMVQQQVSVYREIALYLHRAGLNVYIRKGLDKSPLFISEKGQITVPRWSLQPKPDRPSLKSIAGLKHFFHRRYPIQWLDLGLGGINLSNPGRIAHDGRSFEMVLGKTALQFRPEIALGVSKKYAKKNWLVKGEQSGCSTRTINGFIRIQVGETVVLGSDDKESCELFHFDDNVASRHISITNRRGDLIVSPLSDHPTTLQRIDDCDYREQLERNRHRALLDLAELYGGNIEPMSPKRAFDTIQKALKAFKNEPYREKNGEGKPGGLLEIPQSAAPVIIGDLHGQVDNLLKILSENCVLSCLKMKKAILVFLGDAVHSELTDEMDIFDSSMTIMDLIFQLKIHFPNNVFYLRGNHDSFSSELNKMGVLQGELFKATLLAERGTAYVEAMQQFYDILPYVIHTNSFIGCHAGPPLSEIKRENLININEHPQLALELTKNRIQRPNHLAGYNKRDVKRFRKSLNAPTKTRLIVGHTPMDPFNYFWLHAGNIKNHHILYSAHSGGPGIFIYTGHGFTPLTYPAEPLSELISELL